MTNEYRKGAKVWWRWGAHHAYGKVAQRFERRVQRTIKGEKIIRNGSAKNPVYLLEQTDGGTALKLGSELYAD